jgi:hypothetical protein
MRHKTLINPFNLIQETAHTVSLGTFLTSPSSRSTPVCSTCTSDDVICHAPIQWSNEAQEWQVAGTFEKPAHCNNCRAECHLIWHPFN